MNLQRYKQVIGMPDEKNNRVVVIEQTLQLQTKLDLLVNYKLKDVVSHSGPRTLQGIFFKFYKLIVYILDIILRSLPEFPTH